MEYNPDWIQEYNRRRLVNYDNVGKVHAGYLSMILDPKEFEHKLDRAEEALKNVDFDAFAVRGNSGVLFGGALAARMHKGIILVRKPDDRSHSGMSVEGWTAGKKYLFLDDFVSSGATRRDVITAVRDNQFFNHYQYVGDYLYRDTKYIPRAIEPEPEAEDEDENEYRALSKRVPSYAGSMDVGLLTPWPWDDIGTYYGKKISVDIETKGE